MSEADRPTPEQLEAAREAADNPLVSDPDPQGETGMLVEAFHLRHALAEVDALRDECASISAEFGLPPTMRPVEGEIRRMLERAKSEHARAEAWREYATALDLSYYDIGRPESIEDRLDAARAELAALGEEVP